MAYPSSPEVRLESGSGLDQLIKNTEFENAQHTKAIETERERIKTYSSQLEEKKRQAEELENSTIVLEEQTKKLNKQFEFNKENTESLKHTSTVLTDHEEALRRKLSTLQAEVEQEHTEQCGVLSKYEKLWASYQEKYESKEKFKLLTKKREELHAVQEHHTQLAEQIRELEQIVKPMKQNCDKKLILLSWIMQIASLRCDTNQQLNAMHAEMTTARIVRQEVDLLEVKVQEAVASLEKKEMEAKHLQQQKEAQARYRDQANDVVTMETETAPTANDAPSPNDSMVPQPTDFHLSPQSQPNSNQTAPAEVPNSDITSLAGKTRPSGFLQPPERITNNLAKQQQQTMMNNGARGGQQNKTSRFLSLEVPQLSLPQRSASKQCSNSLAAPRAPLLSSSLSSVARTNAQQPTSSQRRPNQIQMPALRTPSRPKLPSLNVSRPSAISTPSQDHSTQHTATSKSSLRIKVPTQVEVTRPSSGGITVSQQSQPTTSTVAKGKETFQSSISPPPPPPHTNATTVQVASPPQGVVADSATPVAQPQAPQEMQVGWGEDNDLYYSNGPHQDDGQAARMEEGMTDSVVADTGDEQNAANVPAEQEMQMHMQKPLPLTTAIQHATGGEAVNTCAAVGNEVMADASTNYAESSFSNSFNPPPQEMDFNNSQNMTGAYPMYEGEMYYPPNEQNLMQMGGMLGGQLFDAGLSGFSQNDEGGVAFGSGLFTGQGSSSSGGGFFFGGSPATPQQQESNGFGFSFGGGSTPNSNSPFSFSF